MFHTSTEEDSSAGRTTTLGMPERTALRSRRNPPKNGTTLQSGILRALVTASLYSQDGSLDNRALDSMSMTERSSSDSDSQNGFSFSDLQKTKYRVSSF